MSGLRGVWLRLRALLSRAAVDEELDDEMRFHLRMETEKGLEGGLTPKEARRQAVLRFGGVERFKEETRRTRGLSGFDAVFRDTRVSIRMLRRNPIFTLASVTTMALGIGATTAIFSVVDSVLVRPSPFPDADRLVMVWETDRASDTRHEPASWPDVVDFADRSRTLSAIGSMMGMPANLTGPDGVERVTGLAITRGLLEVLSIPPIAGRSFAQGDWSTGSPSVALLGQGFWESRFGADPGIAGRTLTVDGAPITVVGVLPAEADLGVQQIHAQADYSADFMGGDVAIWFAIEPTAPRATHPFLTLGRLSDGVELPAAQAELSDIARELEATYPENADRGVNLESYGQVVFGPVRAALLVLLGSVFLVLLVACANVANLLLARTITRNREVAVRRALGAGAAHIRRQFLVEGIVLSGIGTVLGVALAVGGLEALLAVAPPELPRLQDASLDLRVLAAAATVGAAVALFFGLLPGLHAEYKGVQGSLKAQPSTRSTGGRGIRRFRSVLMVGEVALAVMLVIDAGVLIRSVWELSSVDPGFDTAGVAMMRYDLPQSRYPGDPATAPSWPDIPVIEGFHSALLERVRSLPGVEAAGISANHPLEPGFTNSFVIVGREAESSDFPEIRVRFVSPGYLETVGTALLSGRDFDEGDVARSPPVAMINQAAAERFFPSTDPIGQELRWWGITRTVVGVIGDERFLGLESPSAPAGYLPVAQGALGQATILARTEASPSELLPMIRAQLQDLDPEVPVFGGEPLSAAVSESLSSPRFTATLLGLFAGVALLLALIGVHGVLTYSAAQRSTEVGIRMALGAERGGVVRQIVGEGVSLSGAGVVLGVVGALSVSRLLQSLVYGVTPTDPVTYVVVVMSVLIAAALASFFPAMRASSADLSSTLRAE